MTGATGTHTLRNAIADLAAQLRAADIESPQLDAELLACHAFGLDRAQLRTQSDRELAAAELDQLTALLERRLAHEPIQYIVGRAWFRRLELLVDPRVLIPRPETELLVEQAVLEVNRRQSASADPVRVLDLCTGSGAVAIAIADEARDRAEVVGTDLSADALEVARHNRDTADVPVDFRAGDLWDAVGEQVFDIVVANPPYISRGDLAQLPRSVREHEPHVALFVDEDDQAAFVRRIVAGLDSHLVPGGLAVVEIGMGQERLIEAVFRDAGLVDVHQRADLQGIVRTVGARRPSGPPR